MTQFRDSTILIDTQNGGRGTEKKKNRKEPIKEPESNECFPIEIRAAAPLRSDSTLRLSLEVIQEHTSARNYRKERYKKENSI